MARRKITDELKDKIIELYKQGLSSTEIAHQTSISANSVCKVIKENKVERNIATKGEKKALKRYAVELLGADEAVVDEIIKKLDKRRVIQYRLSLMRLKPFIEELKNASAKN
ncbi:MAG: hypothetical protein Q9M89_08230 [Persephonella sp.]|nr:hypothetical protein [Persephonella sp.]